MRTLGIDYGRKKIGLAVSEGKVAEPYGVIRVESEDEALSKISEVFRKENIERVVVGISEGKMAEEEKAFAEKLAKRLKTKIFFEDETLSSLDSSFFARKLGIKREKRKRLEDAFAASFVLQSFLEKKNV